MQYMEGENFESLPHTADIRFRVWGRTLNEFFRSALRAIAFYLKPEALAAPRSELKERQPIKIEALDTTSLLIEFLSEVIAKIDIRNVVFADLSFQKFNDRFLEGTLWGNKVEGFEKDIKAVSYYEVDIKRNPETGFYETVLVFDV